MNEEQRRDQGMQVRRAVLGDAHVDRASARLSDPMQAEFQDLITRYAWGEIWTRPGLERHTRSLLTIATTVALNRSQSPHRRLRHRETAVGTAHDFIFLSINGQAPL